MSTREYRKRRARALRDQKLIGLGAVLLALFSWAIGCDALLDPALFALPLCVPIGVAGLCGKVVFYI